MNIPTSSHSSGTTIRFSRKMLLGVAGVICLPWAVVAVLAFRSGHQETANTPAASVADRPAQRRGATVADRSLYAGTSPAPGTQFRTDEHAARPASAIRGVASTTGPSDHLVTESNAGPWGKMKIVPIVLEIPDEYAFIASENFAPERWTFTGKNRDAAMAFLQSSGLTAEQLELAQNGKWSITTAGATLEPGDTLILSLSAEARAAVYNTLVLDVANEPVIDPYWFRPDETESRLRGSELSAESLELFKRLLYRSTTGVLLFSDMKPAMRTIKDPAERKRFAKAITRKRSLMARLIVDLDSDVNALAEYWGSDGRQKDLVPVINSLMYNVESGIEQPSYINIVTLLPPFARERLYNHAYSTHSLEMKKEDCFWTAFNFFNAVPDNNFSNLDYTGRILERDYYKIDQPSKLGDLVLVTAANGDAIHAANYIADNIVFTKNGMNVTQPWLLSSLDDMLKTYDLNAKQVHVVYFRKR